MEDALIVLGMLRRSCACSSGRGGGVSARGVILRLPYVGRGEFGSGLNRSSVVGTVRFVREFVTIGAAVGLVAE